ncbi:hypothetical protein GCM10025867_24060 [Frondihabitans sucicola]|uniref:Uncharacterized protein n=1 Tax=Frondihabitans sucicola TaxID=1268041 RepID=A0ABM8GPI8_9MICO|nr:hypothetical protein [Frondihabitans sucicola]BDZ50165.1 hypothetical protein GCM10025867_24060 [Frondihabitans sucicola]
MTPADDHLAPVTPLFGARGPVEVPGRRTMLPLPAAARPGGRPTTNGPRLIGLVPTSLVPTSRVPTSRVPTSPISTRRALTRAEKA